MPYNSVLPDSLAVYDQIPYSPPPIFDRSCSIESTEKNPQNPILPVRGYFDPRRVTTVNQVVAETNYQVTIPHASVAKATTAETSSSKIERVPGPIQLPPHFIPKHQGPFSGTGSFGPGPVRLPNFGRHFGPGHVCLPPSETGATPETLPGGQRTRCMRETAAYSIATAGRRRVLLSSRPTPSNNLLESLFTTPVHRVLHYKDWRTGARW